MNGTSGLIPFLVKECIIGGLLSLIWFKAPFVMWIKWCLCGVLALVFIMILLAFLHVSL